jgi:glucose/arabinose dehydrogenase
LTYQAQSSPIDILFYTADRFSAEVRGNAFVTMRASWNRDQETGYNVFLVRFEDGQPVLIDDFITGWLLDNGVSQFGRVAGLAQMPDGALLIAGDTNGRSIASPTPDRPQLSNGLLARRVRLQVIGRSCPVVEEAPNAEG